jgi:exopolyphosphatase/guanosine-5'-triphosphate,3'-diphosphate pyrophosphatase
MTELSKSTRRTIEILSAFLRLAETLDRSRHGVVRGIEARERMGELRIKIQAVGDAELEIWAAHKQEKALAEALDRQVTIEKVPYRKSSAPSMALTNNSAPVSSRTPAGRGGLRRH